MMSMSQPATQEISMRNNTQILETENEGYGFFGTTISGKHRPPGTPP
jgi:hypothetical protein